MLSRKLAFTILITVILCFLAFDQAQSQAASPGYDYRWEISLGGGYYVPAREGFREYYKNGPEAEITVSYRVSRLWSARVDFFFTRLPEKEVLGDLEFRMFSIVPSAKVTLPRAYEPYFGVGVGYYRGTVYYEGSTVLDPYSYIDEKISKGGVGFKAYGGLKLPLVGVLFFAAEGRYCYTFLGDPYQGDFGNVGGFSAMGKLGVSF
jgi:hypothetical protein